MSRFSGPRKPVAGLPPEMTQPIQLISTDFDGTIYAEFEQPPVPQRLQQLLRDLQAQGTRWVINTGRDLTSLMETLARARLGVRPDYLVLVEREIYLHQGHQYVPLESWNQRCHDAHAQLFARVRPDVPRLTAWIDERFDADVYEDPWSPLCLIARTNPDADAIESFLLDYCRTVPELTLMRNDVYARFSHADFSKGTALREIARHAGVDRTGIFAVGDHFNDLPMLDLAVAAHLAAPGNAMPEVKAAVSRQGGYVCQAARGDGVAEALARILAAA